MSTNAPDLRSPHTINQGQEQLEEFVQIKAAILSNEVFEHFQVNLENQDLLEIATDDLRLTLIDSKTWADQKTQAKLSCQEFDLIIICIEKHETEYIKLPERQRNIVFLNLPMTLLQLAQQLDAFIRLEHRLIHAESLRAQTEEKTDSIKYVLSVSRELNGVRDTNKLLSLILKKAREICGADAGSIYVVEWDENNPSKGNIHFKITQNESVNLDLQEFQIPINENSIVGNAVIHEKSINIEDLYKLDPDRDNNPYRAQHDRSWDDRIGYQCRSMLTVPMFDIANRVIGVIQLINRKGKGVTKLSGRLFDEVKPFDAEIVEYAEIIAYQAGIALENALLTEEKEKLFEGFVHASVTAIEQRDPTTSGHSHRVALLTLETAKLVNRVDHGAYAKTFFNDDNLKEIEYASLLHDFGKLGVREEVLVKAKKLYPLQKRLILERFSHARTSLQRDFLKESLDFLKGPEKFPPGTSEDLLRASRDSKLEEMNQFLDFILKSNEPTVLEQGGFERLKDIAGLYYRDSDYRDCPLLFDDELKALSVSRGSLTREEFAEIQSHVTHTYEFLRKIPWGSSFANLPQIAAKHHEKLDGSGYPTGAEENEIPIQSRIMTIADIYDALTAADRPYKKAMPADRALSIIEMEVKSGKVDSELFKIFVESDIYKITL